MLWCLYVTPITAVAAAAAAIAAIAVVLVIRGSRCCNSIVTLITSGVALDYVAVPC